MTTTLYPPIIDHETATAESFRRDPDFAVAYLNDVLADGEQEEILLSLRLLAKAFGGIAKISQRAGLSEKAVHRMLSAKGTPEFKSLRALCGAMGLRLAVFR
ncbi:MAG: addiction module antidote protein [Deltaproteobacteria bacterium]|jgi:probable addiction module antidote protein|nr:addiction module antidote protein [Deltaproteobacteria bacterium]